MANAGDVRAGGAYVEVSADSRGMKQGLNEAQAHMSAFSGKMSSGLLKLGGAFAGVFAVGKLTSFISESIKLANVQEDAETGLAKAIENTGGAVGRTLEEMKALASARQELTTFGDEATLAAMKTLTAFGSIKGDTFDRTTVAVQDLAAATGADMNSAASLLGKALQDPIMGMSLLRRQGIMLSEEQQNLVKDFVATGNQAGAQAVILGEIEKKYGGMSEKMAGTFSGQVTQFQNAWGDLKEAIGEAIKPILAAVIPAMKSLTVWLQGGISGLGKLGDALTSIRIFFLNMAVTVVDGLNAIITANNKLLGNLGAVGRAFVIDTAPLTNMANDLEDKIRDLKKPAEEVGEAVAEGIKDGMKDGLDTSAMDAPNTLLAKLREEFGAGINFGTSAVATAGSQGTFSARGAGQLGMSVDKQQLDVLKKIQDIMTKQNELIGGLEGGLAA